MAKTYSFLTKLFLFCLAVVACLIAFRSPWGLVLALVETAVFTFVLWKVMSPKFGLILFAVSLIANVFWVMQLHPRIVSDFKYMYEAALACSNGDFSFSEPDYYFSLWAYQIPFVLWQTLFLSIWRSPLCLKLLNCVIGAGSVYAAYRIMLIISKPLPAKICALSIALLPFNMTYSCILQNQTSAAFFALLGLYSFIKPSERRYLKYVISGVLVGVSNLLRPEGIVFLTAVGAWLVFSLFYPQGKKKDVIAGTVIFAVCYFAVQYLCEAVIVSSGISDSISSNLPGWKFVCGLNEESKGRWNKSDWDTVYGTFRDARLTPETDATVTSIISDRIHKTPEQWFSLFLDKIDVQWSMSPLGWAFGYLDFESHPTLSKLYELLKLLDRGVVAFFGLLATIGLVSRKGKSPDSHIFPFVFFASFCVFLLVEVQPRYCYMPEMFLMLSASSGMEAILDKAGIV